MEDNIFDKVHEVDLEKTMKDSYIDYAMSVIASRALPDVRDGGYAAELSLWERNSAVFLWSQYSAMDALQIKITDWREDK